MSAEWSKLYLNPCHILGNVFLKFAQACMVRDYRQFFLCCPQRTDLDIVFEIPQKRKCLGRDVVWCIFCKLVSLTEYVIGELSACYTGLFISPSGISELDCATTKTDTAERSLSIGRESLQVFFCIRGLGVLPGSTARG